MYIKKTPQFSLFFHEISRTLGTMKNKSFHAELICLNKKLCVHEQWGLPESMISANGGQIAIKFTSDNYGSMEGFWLEYEIGIQDTFR